MNAAWDWVVFEWQPLVGLVGGVIVLILYFYLYATRNKIIVPWMAKYIFRNQFMSMQSAESMFKVATSYIFAIAGIWIILALYYIFH